MLKFHKLIILFIFIFSIQEKGNAQAPNYIWAKSMGGIGSAAIGKDITIDSLGNVYTTGYYVGTVDFDPGFGSFNLTSSSWPNYDIFISKLDASGNFIWAKSMGGTDEDVAYSIITDDSGYVYTTGSFKGTSDFDPGLDTFNLSSTGTYHNAYVSKLDALGNFVWAKVLSSTGFIFSTSIALDIAGNVYTTGGFGGSASSVNDLDPGLGLYSLTSAGSYDIFISKLDTSGDFVWAKSMGGNYSDVANSIAIDASGSIYTTGGFSSLPGDFDPGPGTFNLSITAGGDNIFISKLDSSGNFIWAKNMGGTAEEHGTCIAIDGLGNVYTTGKFYGTADFDPNSGTFNLSSVAWSDDIFISKLDSLGNFGWAKQIGGTSDDIAYAIAVDTYDNVYITGSFESTVDFDPNAGTYNFTADSLFDMFITKLDNSGNFVWANVAGGTNVDFSYSLALNVFDEVHLTGYFGGSNISFGSTTLTNTGSVEMFITKLGNILTGIEDQEANNSISLYPNPATDIFTVSFEKNIKKIELSILDITGKIIYSTTESNTQQIEVDTKEFSSGIYFVQITSSDFVETRKLVVAK